MARTKYYQYRTGGQNNNIISIEHMPRTKYEWCRTYGQNNNTVNVEHVSRTTRRLFNAGHHLPVCLCNAELKQVLVIRRDGMALRTGPQVFSLSQKTLKCTDASNDEKENRHGMTGSKPGISNI